MATSKTNRLRRRFSNGPKDERLSAELAGIYKTGFWVLALGMVFCHFTRFNHLAQESAGEGLLASGSLEGGVLVASLVVVGIMMARRGVFSDSIRAVEAASFDQTGLLPVALGLSALVSVAAVGGRVYSEVTLHGWGSVTWAGDVAMLFVMFVQYALLFLACSYLIWRSYRAREDKARSEDD